MSTQKRNIWLDNVKGFLMICVVAGHFLKQELIIIPTCVNLYFCLFTVFTCLYLYLQVD